MLTSSRRYTLHRPAAYTSSLRRLVLGACRKNESTLALKNEETLFFPSPHTLQTPSIVSGELESQIRPAARTRYRLQVVSVIPVRQIHS
jgi:hypothetical protein